MGFGFAVFILSNSSPQVRPPESQHEAHHLTLKRRAWAVVGVTGATGRAAAPGHGAVLTRSLALRSSVKTCALHGTALPCGGCTCWCPSSRPQEEEQSVCLGCSAARYCGNSNAPRLITSWALSCGCCGHSYLAELRPGDRHRPCSWWYRACIEKPCPTQRGLHAPPSKFKFSRVLDRNAGSPGLTPTPINL